MRSFFLREQSLPFALDGSRRIWCVEYHSGWRWPAWVGPSLGAAGPAVTTSRSSVAWPVPRRSTRQPLAPPTPPTYTIPHTSHTHARARTSHETGVNNSRRKKTSSMCSMKRLRLTVEHPPLWCSNSITLICCCSYSWLLSTLYSRTA